MRAGGGATGLSSSSSSSSSYSDSYSDSGEGRGGGVGGAGGVAVLSSYLFPAPILSNSDIGMTIIVVSPVVTIVAVVPLHTHHPCFSSRL